MILPRKSHEDRDRLHSLGQRPAGGRRDGRLPRGRHDGSAEAADLSARGRAAADLEECGALRPGRDLEKFEAEKCGEFYWLITCY